MKRVLRCAADVTALSVALPAAETTESSINSSNSSSSSSGGGGGGGGGLDPSALVEVTGTVLKRRKCPHVLFLVLSIASDDDEQTTNSTQPADQQDRADSPTTVQLVIAPTASPAADTAAAAVHAPGGNLWALGGLCAVGATVRAQGVASKGARCAIDLEVSEGAEGNNEEEGGCGSGRRLQLLRCAADPAAISKVLVAEQAGELPATDAMAALACDDALLRELQSTCGCGSNEYQEGEVDGGGGSAGGERARAKRRMLAAQARRLRGLSPLLLLGSSSWSTSGSSTTVNNKNNNKDMARRRRQRPFRVPKADLAALAAAEAAAAHFEGGQLLQEVERSLGTKDDDSSTGASADTGTDSTSTTSTTSTSGSEDNRRHVYGDCECGGDGCGGPSFPPPLLLLLLLILPQPPWRCRVSVRRPSCR